MTDANKQMITYKFRALPSKGQERRLFEILRGTREFYNAALQERIECYRKTGKGIKLSAQMRSLTEIRADDESIRAVSTLVFRHPLKVLDKAMAAFFRRLKTGDKPGFPRFKSAKRWDSIGLAERFQFADDDGGKWARLAFKGMTGGLRVWRHRAIVGKIKTAFIKKDGKGWCIGIVAEQAEVAAVQTDAGIGIDVGISHFATMDDGTAIPNPRFLERQLKALRVANRSVARKVKGGGHRRRAVAHLRRVHSRVANQRHDFHFQTIAELLKSGVHFAVEDLNIKGLAKGWLSRQVADVGWGQFLTRLTCKAECAGLSVKRVDPKGTSQECLCGATVRKDLSVRVHKCASCGAEMPRDKMSAKIILKRSGFSPLRAGVRPSVVKGGGRETAKPLLAGNPC